MLEPDRTANGEGASTACSWQRHGSAPGRPARLGRGSAEVARNFNFRFPVPFGLLRVADAPPIATNRLVLSCVENALVVHLAGVDRVREEAVPQAFGKGLPPRIWPESVAHLCDTLVHASGGDSDGQNFHSGSAGTGAGAVIWA